MKEILNENKEELKIFNEEIILLQQNIKDNVKEKSPIQNNRERFEKQNKEMKESHQKEKPKLEEEYNQILVCIVDQGVYLDEGEEELEKVKNINSELLKKIKNYKI
jgi:queuine/archaeosine tRNA-ribosyltransferase